MDTPSQDVQGRVAVITGASRGLGAGLASYFLRRGLNLGLCARHRPKMPDSAHCFTQAVDVTDAQSVAKFCEMTAQRLGPIDLWINNAGVLDPIGPLRNTDPTAFARHLEINVLGVYHGCRAFIHHRREQAEGGILINISSGAGRNAYAGWSAYCAAKAAVDRMSQSIALEEADWGLRVHAVSPGIIDTDMQERIRNCSKEEFPMVQKFHDLKAREAFSSPAFIGEHLLQLAFAPELATDNVLVDLPRPS